MSALPDTDKIIEIKIPAKIAGVSRASGGKERAVASKESSKRPSDSEPIDDATIKTQVDRIIRRYTLEAVWPSSDPDYMKQLLQRMMSELADTFHRQPDEISFEDLERAKERMERLALGFGVHRMRLGMLKKQWSRYQKVRPVWELATHGYAFGQLCIGNFSPAVRKYGLKVSGAPLGRASGVWASGQVLAALYWDPKGFQKRLNRHVEFDPLFDSLTLVQLQELGQLMGLKTEGLAPSDIRERILKQLTSSVHNRLQSIWSDVPTYRAILQTLVRELKLAAPSGELSDEALEAWLVEKICQDTLTELSTENLQQLDQVIRQNLGDSYWRDGLLASLKAGGMVLGRAQSKRLALAATTSLGVLGRSLGMSSGLAAYGQVGAAVSQLFGPLGIAAASGAALLHWTKARPRKALPFVLYMGLMRASLKLDTQQKLSIWQKIKRYARLVGQLLGRWLGRSHKPSRYGADRELTG